MKKKNQLKTDLKYLYLIQLFYLLVLMFMTY